MTAGRYKANELKNMKLIDEERLKELLVAEAFAEILERNGVDEWDYYEEALRDDYNGMSYFEFISQSSKDITKDFKTV